MLCDGRRCPLGDEDKQLFEETLKEISQNFSDSWLALKSSHPLQILWNRRDILASIELHMLGESIRKLKSISPDQLRQNIILLKSDDQGTMAGAIWEIILAAAFSNPPQQKSRLLGPRRPTYDIEVEKENNTKLRISVKNFGQSKKDKEFLSQFQSIEQIVKNHANTNIQIKIIRADQFPTMQDWDYLKRILLRCLRSTSISSFSDNGWDIIIRSLTYDHIKDRVGLDEAKLYSNEISYTLFMASPFYKNEDKNIESKLGEACEDLICKGAMESDNLKNWLFIHLPEYVYMGDYVEWCNRFFRKNPKAPITNITLIQPAYVTNPDRDESFLAINHKEINKHSKETTRNLHIEFPIGIPVNSIKRFLGPDFEIPKKHYMMQSGHIYIDCGDMTHGGKMKTRFDYGIKTDAIAELNGEKFWISGNFPPTTKLVIL